MPPQPARRLCIPGHHLRPKPQQLRYRRMPPQHRHIPGRIPPPQAQRLLIEPARRRCVARRRSGPGLPRQLPEQHHIQLPGPRPQPVPRHAGRGQHPISARRIQHPPQPAHMRRHQLRRRPRRPLSPQHIDNRLPPHQLTGCQREQRQHRPPTRRPQPQRHPVPPRRHRPQHRDPQPRARPGRQARIRRCRARVLRRGSGQRARLPRIQVQRPGQRRQRPRPRPVTTALLHIPHRRHAQPRPGSQLPLRQPRRPPPPPHQSAQPRSGSALPSIHHHSPSRSQPIPPPRRPAIPRQQPISPTIVWQNDRGEVPHYRTRAARGLQPGPEQA